MVQGTMPKYFMVPLLTTLKHERRQTLSGVILLFTSFSGILEHVPVEDLKNEALSLAVTCYRRS